MVKTVNETSSRDPYLLPGKNTDNEDLLAKMINAPEKNHEFVDFTQPPAPQPKKTAPESEIDNVVELYQKQENLEVVEGAIHNPWHYDSIARSGETQVIIPVKTIPVEAKKVAEQSPPPEARLSAVEELSDAIEEVDRKSKNGKIKSSFEMRFFDTMSSAAEKAPEAPPEAVEEAKVEEKPQQKSSWFKQIWDEVWDKAVSLWDNLFGNKKPETAAPKEVDGIDGIEDEKNTSPLNQRPVLDQPFPVGRQQLKKLKQEMNDLLRRMEDSLRANEELSKSGDADVILMLMIKMASLRQDSLNKEDVQARTAFQNELQERSKECMAKINKVKEDLEGKQDLSKKLGWVNMTLTAIGLVGTVALLIGTGGTALPIIVAAAGLFNGIGVIWKGVVDYQASKNKGEVEFIATNKQLINHMMESNIADMQHVLSSMHQDIERIIMALAMMRETIRHGQMMS